MESNDKITKEILVSPLSIQSTVLDNLANTLEDNVTAPDYQGTPIGHILDNVSQVGAGLLQENMIEMVKIMVVVVQKYM